MVSRISPGHPLRKLFSGLVEQVFMADMGICDLQLTEYLGEMLLDFVHVDRIYCMRNVSGEAIREISRLEAEAYLGPSTDCSARSRLINRYIGDFTLFWAGIYPESLRPPRVGVDRLHVYLIQGKRSYGIASELSRAESDPPATLLRCLSDEFEYCVHGLHLVRDSWERLSRQQEGN